MPFKKRRVEVAFIGTRLGMTSNQKKAFIDFLCSNRLSEFHQGCSIGADSEAFWLWAEIGNGVGHCWPTYVDNQLTTFLTKEDIETYGLVIHDRMLMLERNLEMVEWCRILVVAEHESYSTASIQYAINYALSKKKTVIYL